MCIRDSARFDEENNIGWSKKMEEAGVKIIYGLDALKVHSKLLLITRKQGSNIRYYTQIGTGNYNEKTSRLYTDLTLMTSDKDIAVSYTHLDVYKRQRSKSKLTQTALHRRRKAKPPSLLPMPCL